MDCVRRHALEAGARALVTEHATAVVTGATGFVGGGLLRALERDGGAPVRCLVRDPSKLTGDAGVTVVPGSLEELPRELFPETPYVVYHLATEQHDPGELGFVDTNLRNVRRLGESLTGPCRGVIYLSSLSVLGQGRQAGVDESAPVAPRTELATARAKVEEYLLALGARIEASVFCVRPRFVLGRGDSRTLPGLHRFMRSGLMPSTGSQRFSIIDVDDLGDVLARLGARCEAYHDAGAPVRTPIHAAYREPVSWRAIRSELRAGVGGIPPVAFPLPLALRHLGRLGSPGLRSAAEKLELFGRSHWTRVDRLESELGPSVTVRDAYAALRSAVRSIHAAGAR